MSLCTPRSRRQIGFALRAALALGLLGLALWMNREQIAEVSRRSPDLRFVALATALYLAGLVLAYGRWFLLVRSLGLPFRPRDALRLGFIGALFNFVIPGAIFGNVVKAAFLCREQPGRKPRAIASVAVDFLSGLLALFGLAAVVGTVAGPGLDPRVRRLVVVAWVATLVVGFALLATLDPRVGRLARALRRKAEGVESAGAAFRGRWAVVPLAVALGLGTHTLNVLAFYFVRMALFPEVPSLTAHFLLVPLVLFSTAVPLPFGALGLSEQVSSGLFRLLGDRAGAVAMLGYRLLQLVGALIGAAIYMANAQQVRALAAQSSRGDTDEMSVIESNAPHARRSVETSPQTGSL